MPGTILESGDPKLHPCIGGADSPVWVQLSKKNKMVSSSNPCDEENKIQVAERLFLLDLHVMSERAEGRCEGQQGCNS